MESEFGHGRTHQGYGTRVCTAITGVLIKFATITALFFSVFISLGSSALAVPHSAMVATADRNKERSVNHGCLILTVTAGICLRTLHASK